MKMKIGTTASGLLVIALPLVMAAGCAGNKQNVVQIDPAQEESQEVDNGTQETTEQLAIATMDGYMAQLERQQEAEAVEEVEAPVDTSQPTEEGAAQIPNALSDEELVLQEPVDSAEMDAAAGNEGSPATDEAIPVSPPTQKVFYFNSNSDIPVAGDYVIILEHAEYLKSHPHRFLVISGHADNRGSKVYNQNLSERRAQSIASILSAAGVPGEQMRVGGMGESIPMTDPTRWQENRRVEFSYQDSMMATNP